MRLIDLSHTFTDNILTYPGDPMPSLKELASVKQNGYADHLLTTGLHVGTHVDAPAHMIVGGKHIDELPLERFSGPGILVEAAGAKMLGQELLPARLPKGAVVLFHTGFDKKFGTADYFSDFPVMTEELARELVARDIKLIGLDTPTPDREPYTVHQILLGAGVLIIENLANLERLFGTKKFTVEAYPVKFKSGGAFARVFARVRN